MTKVLCFWSHMTDRFWMSCIVPKFLKSLRLGRIVRYWLSGNVRGKKLWVQTSNREETSNLWFACQLTTSSKHKRYKRYGTWGAEQHRSIFNAIWFVLELSQRYSWFKSPEMTQFLRRGECYAMMFQGSRNLDLQPIAHLAHWVVAMLCNVWIHILGPPISDQLLEYHHRLTFHGNKEWERSRKTRLAKLQKEMEKLQTTITHDEDYIARLGGMNFQYATYMYLPVVGMIRYDVFLNKNIVNLVCFI